MRGFSSEFAQFLLYKESSHCVVGCCKKLEQGRDWRGRQISLPNGQRVRNREQEKNRLQLLGKGPEPFESTAMTSHVLGYTILFMLWMCCTAQDEVGCGPPPRRDNEELADPSGKSSYSQNDIVSYNCRLGFIKVGRLRFKCNQGSWEQIPPFIQCKRRPCGHPGDTEFGSFELVQGNEFVFGSRVEYQCDPGYQMLSQTNYRVCQANGWSNDVPHCEVMKCFPVKSPENGRIILTGIHGIDQDFVFGQALQFECNAKFRLVGAKQIVCADEGQWQPPVPTCEEIICNPGTITNGVITSANQVYKEGDELRFECRSGYKPIDRWVAVCSENGWNTKLECTEIICSSPAVNNGRVNPHKERYFSEETVQVQCDPGYQPALREGIPKCTKDGWLPKPKCVSKLCDYPEERNVEVHGYPWEYRNQYFPKREGDYIYFRCKDGFLRENKAQSWQYSTCTISGWDPKPKCFKQCDHRSRFPHGHFISSYWSKFIEGDEISFSCDTGYHPEPQAAKSSCTKNGWSPTPRCIPREIPICKRDPLLNGFFTDRKDQFSLNDKTRYRCRIGFTTRQGKEDGEIVCHRDGWTPKPECVKTCPKPTEGNVIINITKSVFFLEENLPFKCEEGYETINKTLEHHSDCTENGWSPKPQCLSIKCEAPILDNGYIWPRNDQFLYSDVVQFSCDQQHVRVGPLSSQCYHFGWSPPPPTCKGEVRSCQPPSSITDGRIITAVQEEYPHGQQVEYECNLRYAMTGSKKVECVDGQWTSLPSCTAEGRTCARPPRIPNGTPAWTDGEQYIHGDTVTYECIGSTAIVGTNPAKCLHGQWDLPSCDDGCAPPKIPKNTNSDPLRDHYNNGEIVSYSCDSIQHATKCVKGKWSPEPECSGKDRDLCPPPPQLPNAIKITAVRNYENGEKVQFTCKEHFLLEGPEEILCKDGKWKTPPRCVDTRCRNPPLIANGHSVNGAQGNYLPGIEVEYRCNEGFQLGEIRSSTCKNGVWIQTPTCNDVRCGNPPPIANGNAVNGSQGKYLPGIRVEYRCNEGFHISKTKSSTCGNGVWTQTPTCKEKPCGPPPQVFDSSLTKRMRTSYQPGEEVHYICHPGFTSDGPLSVTCRKGEWTEPPICEDEQCPPPGKIAHGEIVGQLKERYMPFETVRFQCHQGWTLSGQGVVRCLNRQWTKLPKCTDPKANCGRAPSIQNGDILDRVQAEYLPGTRLQYKCQNMYVMNGSAEIRCENGDWTQPPTCLEACTVTEEDMRRNNIQFKYRSDQKLYSVSGDRIEFQCIQNHQPDPSSPPMRAWCIAGRVEYPRCIQNY